MQRVETYLLIHVQIRETFGLSGVALAERTEGGWHTVRSTGEVPANPGVKVQVGERFVLVGAGRLLPASDRRVLDAFAVHAAAALERGRLAERAAEAAGLAATDRLRTALLRAVGRLLPTRSGRSRCSVIATWPRSRTLPSPGPSARPYLPPLAPPYAPPCAPPHAVSGRQSAASAAVETVTAAR